MNTYGHQARDYLARHRPAALAAIADPEAHFTELGEQIAAEVENLEAGLAGPAPPGETFLERVGRLNMARLMAEERVMGEVVYSSGEEDPESAAASPTTWEPLLPADPDPEE